MTPQTSWLFNCWQWECISALPVQLSKEAQACDQFSYRIWLWRAVVPLLISFNVALLCLHSDTDTQMRWCQDIKGGIITWHPDLEVLPLPTPAAVYSEAHFKEHQGLLDRNPCSPSSEVHVIISQLSSPKDLCDRYDFIIRASGLSQEWVSWKNQCVRFGWGVVLPRVPLSLKPCQANHSYLWLMSAHTSCSKCMVSAASGKLLLFLGFWESALDSVAYKVISSPKLLTSTMEDHGRMLLSIHSFLGICLGLTKVLRRRIQNRNTSVPLLALPQSASGSPHMLVSFLMAIRQC